MDAADYDRALRYAAWGSDLAALLHLLQSRDHVHTRAGTGGDQTFRQVLADLMAEHGRTHEEGLLRDLGKHVMVHHGKVVPARYDLSIPAYGFREALEAQNEAANAEWFHDDVLFRDVSGRSPRRLDDEDRDLDERGDRGDFDGDDDEGGDEHNYDPTPHPYGTVELEHTPRDSDGWATGDTTYRYYHPSEIGNVLADHVADSENYDDMGWNTDDPPGVRSAEDHQQLLDAYYTHLKLLRDVPFESPTAE